MTYKYEVYYWHYLTEQQLVTMLSLILIYRVFMHIL